MKHKPKAHPKQTREEKKAAAIAAVRTQAEHEALYFFHDPMRKAYATVPKGDHRETWRIRSKDFRLWVKQVLYDKTGAAPDKLVKKITEEFEAHAICKGPTHEVHVRIAEQDGATYIDLGNDQWQALEISADGWKLVDEPPVKFRRPVGMTALPYPKSGGTIRDVVRFLNISPKSEVLLLTWLTYALRCGTPYPVIALSGVQGAGKSTITKVLRALIDPSLAEMTTVPNSERDVAIAASNSHLIAMDNLSEISPALSDVMCRVATGGSFRTRELYTNDDEVILTYRRPLIINGIEELPIRPDLLDRSIIIHVEPIPEDKRRDERAFWSDFEGVRPELLGAMLDVIQVGLQRVDSVNLLTAPRMADFARWGVATEQAAGYAEGTFMAAYSDNREDANAAALEGSPIAKALYEFLGEQITSMRNGQWLPTGYKRTFDGTALSLLEQLRDFCDRGSYSSRKGNEGIRELLRHPRFPKTANALSAEIARIEPNLKKLNITVVRGRNHEGRFLRLARTDLPNLESKPEQLHYPSNAETESEVRKIVKAVLPHEPTITVKSSRKVLLEFDRTKYSSYDRDYKKGLLDSLGKALKDAGWESDSLASFEQGACKFRINRVKRDDAQAKTDTPQVVVEAVA